MKLKSKGMLLAFLFVLAFVLTSCTSAVQTAAEKAKQEKVIGILEDAQEDLESVQTVLSDTDLDMADEKKDEDTSDKSQQEQLKEIEDLQVKIQGYKDDLGKRINGIKERDAQKDANLESFNKSELHCVQLLSEVLDEYDGIINYLKVLFKVSDTMTGLGEMDINNLESWYKNFSETIQSTMDELNATTPPSFLQAFHTKLIKGIGDAQSSVQYILNAGAIRDYLRMDAGTYRIGVFLREFNTAFTEAQTAIERREAKIKDDAAALKKMHDGLNAWIEDNLEELDKEGSAKK